MQKKKGKRKEKQRLTTLFTLRISKLIESKEKLRRQYKMKSEEPMLQRRQLIRSRSRRKERQLSSKPGQLTPNKGRKLTLKRPKLLSRKESKKRKRTKWRRKLKRNRRKKMLNVKPRWNMKRRRRGKQKLKPKLKLRPRPRE